MPKANNYGLILAGGRGTRFWPRSRRARAKQVLSFFGDRSLIQQTVDRLKPILPPERIWVLTNDHLRNEIARQLPEIPKKQIIAEPAQRNTAPAIGLAAHMIESVDPDAVMGVFPADHIIQKPSRYVKLLRPAFRAAAEGHIAVLGIQPRWVETGYGYVEFPEGVEPGSAAPSQVLSFREKPDQETAGQFVASGRFCWNAGMFFWRTSVVLEELRRNLPATSKLIDALPPFGSRRFVAALAETYPKAENISIDYAVLEKAKDVVGLIAGDIGWSDVGSWNAVYELLPRDPKGNAGRGEALAIDSEGTYFDVDGKVVALVGIKDLVIVDTPDALLIADRRRAQQVGDLVKLLEKQNRDDLL
jgi:mannose-1-phosphate guanylyltransferase